MKRGTSSLPSVPEGPSARYHPPCQPSLLLITQSCVSMVICGCTAKLKLPGVPVAMDLASVISEHKTMAPSCEAICSGGADCF